MEIPQEEVLIELSEIERRLKKFAGISVIGRLSR
jgi:hypothetical protein